MTGLESLGWELTVCNSLEPVDSVCRKYLAKPGTFGELLAGYLGRFIDLSSVKKMLEVGGGYGYLTRDFLASNRRAEAVMLDISPYLLEKQRQTLKEKRADFLLMDFFDADEVFLSGFDLALFNENIGDFPCACGLTEDILSEADSPGTDPGIKESAYLIKRYGLDIPREPFNFNLGAVSAVSRVCGAGVRAAWFSEHSCEAEAPERFRKFIDTGSTGRPERIPLKDHDEYTIKFSHLEKTARGHGYSVIRGSYLDFIVPLESPGLNFILSSCSAKDEHETVRQFIWDLCKYEYLFIIRPDERP
jgi:SAM-dependent methyltransferase